MSWLRSLVLAAILLAASHAPAWAAISFVGSAVGSSSPNTGTTVTLPGGMQAGDIIIVVGGVGDTVDNGLAAPTEGGYTDVLGAGDLYSNDTNDANLDLFYKFHNGTDTTVSFGAVGGTNASNVAVVMVFRGVDIDSPFDVTTTTATGIDTSNADPPSIDHSGTAGVWTVIAAVTGHTGGATATFTAPTGYTTNFAFRAHNDTIDALAGMGYNSSPSDPENPGALTAANIGTASANAWGAVTIALRPAILTFGAKRQSVYTDGFTSGSAAPYTTNVQSGNLLIAAFGRATDSTPTVTDTQGNTWAIARSHYSAGSDYRLDVWYAKAGSNGANSVTITATGGAGERTIAEYIGPFDATPLDNVNSAEGTSSTPSSGNITPTVDGALILGYIGADPANTNFTPGTGFTADNEQNTGTNVDTLLESLVQGTAAAQAADGTLSGSVVWLSIVTSFQPVAAGGAASPQRSLLGVGQ